MRIGSPSHNGTLSKKNAFAYGGLLQVDLFAVRGNEGIQARAQSNQV